MFAMLLDNGFFKFHAAFVMAALLFSHSIAIGNEVDLQNSRTMKEFVQDNPSCIDFTDGCSVCTVSKGEISCSAPRIQCQVTPLMCTRQ